MPPQLRIAARIDFTPSLICSLFNMAISRTMGLPSGGVGALGARRPNPGSRDTLPQERIPHGALPLGNPIAIRPIAPDLGRGAGLKPRTCFSVISSASPCGVPASSVNRRGLATRSVSIKSGTCSADQRCDLPRGNTSAFTVVMSAFDLTQYKPP